MPFPSRSRTPAWAVPVPDFAGNSPPDGLEAAGRAYACAYAYGAACMRPPATACDTGKGIARARGRARGTPEAASGTGLPAQAGFLQGIVKRRGRDSNPRSGCPDTGFRALPTPPRRHSKTRAFRGLEPSSDGAHTPSHMPIPQRSATWRGSRRGGCPKSPCRSAEAAVRPAAGSGHRRKTAAALRAHPSGPVERPRGR
jgi:hypothetical protein